MFENIAKWSFLHWALVVVAIIISLILLGWNYSEFSDRCHSRKIPSRIAFFIYLIPYTMLISMLTGNVFEMIIFAPKKLKEKVIKLYKKAFPSKTCENCIHFNKQTCNVQNYYKYKDQNIVCEDKNLWEEH